MSKPIVVVGSINFDLVVSSDRIPALGETIKGTNLQMHPGGKGANQAVAIARLGYPVSLIGKLGSDPFGAQLRDALLESGVDCTCVSAVPGRSGVAMIVVTPQGDNSILIISGANAQLHPEDLDAHIDVIRGAGLVMTQLEIPMATVEHLAALCRREGIPLMLDPAPAQPLPGSLLERVTWFTPNETEAAYYFAQLDSPDDHSTSLDGTRSAESSEIMRKLLGCGVNGVVLKLGASGAHIATLQGLDAKLPSVPVAVVDTTAAGDAFNGAFATGLMLGKHALESAAFAIAAAAMSVTKHGAQPSMATLAETEDLLQTVL